MAQTLTAELDAWLKLRLMGRGLHQEVQHVRNHHMALSAAQLRLGGSAR
jgi:hypothetical protein